MLSFILSKLLRLSIQRQTTRLAILVAIKVTCSLLKLTQSSSMQFYSKLLAIKFFTVSSAVHITCCAINVFI